MTELVQVHVTRKRVEEKETDSKNPVSGLAPLRSQDVVRTLRPTVTTSCLTCRLPFRRLRYRHCLYLTGAKRFTRESPPYLWTRSLLTTRQTVTPLAGIGLSCSRPSFFPSTRRGECGERYLHGGGLDERSFRSWVETAESLESWCGPPPREGHTPPSVGRNLVFPAPDE